MFFTICNNCHLPSMEGQRICAECGSNLMEEELYEGDNLTGVIFEKRYRLEQYIDEGAMAWVYRGVHVDLGSSVAVKILKPSFHTDERFVERFKQEAIAAGSLNHPNILSIITSTTTSTGFTYIVSEFISGKSLAKILETQRKLPLSRVIKIISQILSALDEAHSKGIIHRDIKPENVMIISLRSGEDFIKLVDFGIARQSENNDLKLTKHGELFGTPEYMAPEVIRGKQASKVSDLYSVGIILFEMLAGDVPFTGEVIFDVLRAHLEEEIKSVSVKNEEIPFAFDLLIKKVLAKDPDERPQSAIEFKNLLLETYDEASGVFQCTICGYSLESSCKFCPNCGTNLASTTAEVEKIEEENTVLPESKAVVSQSTRTIQQLLVREKALEPIFIGREKEIDEITSFLYSEKVVLEISGITGIGKTSLAEYIIGAIDSDSVLKYACYPDPSLCRMPWYPVKTLIGNILELDQDCSFEKIKEKLSGMRLEPDDYQHIYKLLDSSAPDIPVERAVKLREIITSAIRVVMAAASQKAAIILFDDIDEYDYPSRIFIDRLITNSSGFPVKVILTTEESFIVPNESSQSVVLTRLDDEALKPVILQTISRKTDSWHGLFEKLFSNSFGLPLHLIEGIHLIMEGGSEVGSSLADIVTLRIRRLPSAALRIMQLSSLYGKIVPLKLVYETEGKTEDTENAISLLVRRGYINHINALEIQISHPIYNKLVTSSMTMELQYKLNDIIRNFLLNNGASTLKIAYHTLKCNKLDEAFWLCEEAGDHCEKCLDDPGAVDFYRSAFEISRFSTLQGHGPENFIRLSLKLGDVLRYTSQYLESENILKEGLLFCEDSPESEAAILSSLARLTISNPNGQSDKEKAGALINRAARKANETQKPELIYKVFFDLSSIEISRQRYEKGAQMLRDGMERIMSLKEPPDDFWRLFLRLAELEFSGNKKEEAIEILMQSVNMIDSRLPQWKLALGRIHYLLGRFFMEMDRKSDALIHLMQAVEYLQNIGDRLSAAEASLAVVEMDPAKLEHLEKAIYLSMQIGWKQGLEKARRLKDSIRF
ncbi:MAG: protein kinase [Deltaproteobacteria bacterium]|nr:protein kinase [Deltaproteobacteria bacterium]